MDLGGLIGLILSDYTMRTVSLGAAILGLVSGVLGSYAVLRKQSLLGDAMSHAALPGVVLAFMITGSKAPLALMLGAIITGWLGALVVIGITGHTRIKQDASLGIVLAVFFGLGTALLSWVQRHSASVSQSGLDKFLFGRAAALVEHDVIAMATMGIIALVSVLLFWKEFKLISFNPEYAASLGIPVRALEVFLTTLIVVAIVVGLQTVGVVLMSAMIIAPSSAARQWTDRLGIMVLLAGLLGALAGVVGALISSLASGLSTGPVIVLSASALVLISIVAAPHRGLLARGIRSRRSRRRLRSAAVLETLYQMGLQHGDPRRPHSYQHLKAAMPGRGVAFTLEKLQKEGLVLEQHEEHWALSAAGVAQAEAMIHPTRAEDQPQPMGAGR
ncbi:MAG: metal ABC transporter permease [Anaerolineales bacterium]|nr:MAG: metal ABC transporter permease [Anaerolineales bacterium]